MEFKILGPLEVVDDGERLDLGGAKQRALLAVLLLEANRVVSTDRLIDALWGESPPGQARKTLQVYVSQLRKAVGRDRIETRSPGYLVHVGENELDLHRFRTLAGQSEFGQALALFRGRPLADFESEQFAIVEAARLDELRLACLEDRIDADLATGGHAGVAGELESLVREHPLRERLRAQLMLALYRSGRQAEALEAFQDARRALVDELGIEPTRSLRDLHQSILRQDGTLDLDAAPEKEREAPPDSPSAVTTASASVPEPRAERKTVTAIHVRAAVTSEHGGDLDPEVLTRVLSRAHDEVTRAIEAHEGMIDTLAGDSVSGVFGLPVVHEDDPLRAARAADDLQTRLTNLAAELERASSARLDFRMGVSTGEVMAGGALGRLRATGEPLARAARLSQEAEPRGIRFDEQTRRAVAARRDMSRFASPMVGRARERRRLLDAFEQAVGDRSCQLFTILGAAGVGKSRLVQEFLGDLGEGCRVTRGRCLPYGEGITFWPVLETLRDIGGLDETDTPDAAQARLVALLDEEDEAELVAQRITDVVGLTEGGSQVEEGFQAIRTYFELVAAREPLVVVFDDVHWGEETFHDLVEHLAEWTRSAPLLLLCMARPELLDSRPTWGGGKLNATSALLEPLSDAESAELVANLVGEATLAEEVQERIASAAEGNPLFVEEMLSMLIDEEILVRDNGRWAVVRDLASFPVPPTIHALLAARLDQLGEEERTAIESAAVEGKVFHETSVVELSQGDSAAALASLVRKELIRPERPVFSGERAFRFRHLMIRDAAYDAIPKERRAVLHQRHVGWLEQRTSERYGEFDEIVGYHLEQAARYRNELGHADEKSRELGRRAAERLGAAGRRAFVRSDVPAGLNLVSRAVALLPADDPLRVELVPNMRVVQSISDVSELRWADRALTEAIEAAATTGDRHLAAHALVQRALLRLFTEADVTSQEVLQTANQAIDAFEIWGDELGLARAWRLAAQGHYLARVAEASAEAAERALHHARRAVDRFEQVEVVEWLLIALLFGPCPAAEGSDRCRRLLSEVAGHPELEARVAAALAWFEAAQGHVEPTGELLADARRAMDDHGVIISFVIFYGASTLMLERDRAEAEAVLRVGYDTLWKMGRSGHYGAIALRLAQLRYANGLLEDAETYLEEVAECLRANDVWDQSHWRAERAKILARRGDFAAGEELAQEAAAFAATSDFITAQADAMLDLGEVLQLSGRREEAAAAIADAIDLYDRKGNVLASGQARDLLEDLQHGEGEQPRGRT